MTGSATELAPLLSAIARVCEADGVTLKTLRAIHFGDEEISIHVRRSDGRCRVNTYPIAALRGPVRTRGGDAPAIQSLPATDQAGPPLRR